MEAPTITKYNLLIVGVGEAGSIGYQTAHQCYDLESIDKLFLFNHRPETVEACERSLLASPSKERKEIIILREEKDLEEILGDIDFSVISIGSKKNEPDRMKHINLHTLNGIMSLATHFRNTDYKGNTVVLTNPTDIITYVWALYSGQHPNTVIGVNYLDTTRLHTVVCDALQGIAEERGVKDFKFDPKEIEVFCIGPHTDKAIPYLVSLWKGEQGKGYPAPLSIIGTKEAFDAFRKAVDEEMNFVYRVGGGTQTETAKAVRYTLESMMGKDSVLTASVFIDLNNPNFECLSKINSDGGLYLGMPVHFESGFVRINNLPYKTGYAINAFGEEYERFFYLLQKLRSGEPCPDTGEPMKIDGYVTMPKAEPKRKMGHKVAIPEKAAVAEKPTVQVLIPSPTQQIVIPKPLETRLYVASGREVIEFNGNLEEIERYPFGSTIRAVKVIDDTVYGGYKDGIASLKKGRHDAIWIHAIPGFNTKVAGFGTNSMVLWNGKLYFTNSDYGVGCFDSKGRCGKVFENITKNNRVTRGVTESGGLLYFSSGESVYSAENEMSANLLFQGEDEILAFVLGQSIYAVDAANNLLRWKSSNLERLRKGNRLVGLRNASIDGKEYLFTMDAFGSVQRLDSDFISSINYQGASLGTVADYAFVGYANGLVFASANKEGSGDYRIKVWDFNKPEGPLKEIRLQHTIRDAVAR